MFSLLLKEFIFEFFFFFFFFFGHDEDYCMKKPICGNCGGERHCNDDRNCKNTAKCVNCSGNHPFFSRDCPTWRKEKAILKVKYEKSVIFPEARKIVEEQFAAQAKVTPASLKLPVYTFHALMHKRKQMKLALLNVSYIKCRE